MRVLLTGASGFVGSHVLESLVSRGIDTAVLVRSSSKRDFIAPYLDRIQVCTGSILDRTGLDHALEGITHVIHCAGLTRARRPEEFFEGNHIGTRNVVEAVNSHGDHIKRLVYISSLAAAGPCRLGERLSEDRPARPVSVYGTSKLMAEREVVGRCRTDYVVLRPPAVYGPRDDGFLSLFQVVKMRVRPSFIGGIKQMSFLYVKDLAEAILQVLLHPQAAGKTYFVAGREVVSPQDFMAMIARSMGVRVVSVPIPVQLMWPVCALQELMARITNRPVIVNRQKYAEFCSQAWVCDPSRIERELGVVCPTPLREGIQETIRWYRQHGWL